MSKNYIYTLFRIEDLLSSSKLYEKEIEWSVNLLFCILFNSHVLYIFKLSDLSANFYKTIAISD